MRSSSFLCLQKGKCQSRNFENRLVAECFRLFALHMFLAWPLLHKRDFFDRSLHFIILLRLSDKVKKLLEVMSYEPMSAKEIMQLLGLTRRQTFRNAYLRPAMAQGLVEMTEPNNPNSRNQKYYKK